MQKRLWGILYFPKSAQLVATLPNIAEKNVKLKHLFSLKTPKN